MSKKKKNKTKPDQRPTVVDPVIILYKDRGKLTCALHHMEEFGHEGYGLAIADIIRHTARAFDCHISEVRAWVDRELNNPTTDIEGFRL